MSVFKQIRSYLDMSQQEFADELGVTFATVNRWENGRASANRLAQEKVFELCVKNNIPLINMIQDRLDAERAMIDVEDGRIILYHGSKAGIDGKIQPISREHCDFGKGFYMGSEPMQPLTLVCDYEKAKFYILSIGLDRVKMLHVPADLEWAMLVAYHRGRMANIIGTKLYRKYEDLSKAYDGIVGSIADDRMFYVLDNFFQGNITDIALTRSLSALQLGMQYVMITQNGCDAVRVEREIPLSLLERKFLQMLSEENRARGVNLANDICRNHRREGRYFDEILEFGEEA